MAESNGGATAAIGTLTKKRQRKPNVRLGDIGIGSDYTFAEVNIANLRPPNSGSKKPQEQKKEGNEKETLILEGNLPIARWKGKESESRMEDEEKSDDSRMNDEEGKGRGNSKGNDSDAVKVWLNSLGLGKYAPVFEVHEVDEEVLPMLTLDDLKEMGISAVGSRRKMFCSIQRLGRAL